MLYGSLQEEFEEYSEKAKTLPERTTNENKLILYRLYKQATDGNVNTDRPGIFYQKDRYKWDAWKAVEDMTKMEDHYGRDGTTNVAIAGELLQLKTPKKWG